MPISVNVNGEWKTVVSSFGNGNSVLAESFSNWEIITESGTWVTPKSGIYLFCLVGGGGGGHYSAPNMSGGGHGGIIFYFLPLSKDRELLLQIGAGGYAAEGLTAAGMGGTTSVIGSNFSIDAPGGAAGSGRGDNYPAYGAMGQSSDSAPYQHMKFNDEVIYTKMATYGGGGRRSNYPGPGGSGSIGILY